MAECATCGEQYSAKRAALGYKTCTRCGDKEAREARKSWTVAPVHKSNYVLITNRNELIGLNNKTKG